jgi:hypothetical protein
LLILTHIAAALRGAEEAATIIGATDLAAVLSSAIRQAEYELAGRPEDEEIPDRSVTASLRGK